MRNEKHAEKMLEEYFSKKNSTMEEHIGVILQWKEIVITASRKLFDACTSLGETLKNDAEVISYLAHKFPSLLNCIISLLGQTFEPLPPAAQKNLLVLALLLLKTGPMTRVEAWDSLREQLPLFVDMLFSPTACSEVSTAACNLLAFLSFFPSGTVEGVLMGEVGLTNSHILLRTSELLQSLPGQAILSNTHLDTVLENVLLVLRLFLVASGCVLGLVLTLTDEHLCNWLSILRFCFGATEKASSSPNPAIRHHLFLLVTTAAYFPVTGNAAVVAEELFQKWLGEEHEDVILDPTERWAVYAISQMHKAGTVWNRLHGKLQKKVGGPTPPGPELTLTTLEEGLGSLFKDIIYIMESSIEEHQILAVEVFTTLPGVFPLMCKLIHSGDDDLLMRQALPLWSKCILQDEKLALRYNTNEDAHLFHHFVVEQFVAQGGLLYREDLLREWKKESAITALLDVIYYLCKHPTLLYAPLLYGSAGIVAGIVDALHPLAEALSCEGDFAIDDAECFFSANENLHYCVRCFEIIALLTEGRCNRGCVIDAVPEEAVADISTIISQGKKYPAIVETGLDILVNLTSLYPYAISSTLDFEFLSKFFSLEDDTLSPWKRSTDVTWCSLAVGSLKIMTILATCIPQAVTLEWIEILRLAIRYVQVSLSTATGAAASSCNVVLEEALWQCVLSSLRTSDECAEYLFDDDTQCAIVECLQKQNFSADSSVLTLLSVAAFLPAVQSRALESALLPFVRHVFGRDVSQEEIDWRLGEALVSFAVCKQDEIAASFLAELMLGIFFHSRVSSLKSGSECERLIALKNGLLGAAKAQVSTVALELILRCHEAIFNAPGRKKTGGAEDQGVLVMREDDAYADQEREERLFFSAACLLEWLRTTAQQGCLPSVRDALVDLLSELRNARATTQLDCSVILKACPDLLLAVELSFGLPTSCPPTFHVADGKDCHVPEKQLITLRVLRIASFLLGAASSVQGSDSNSIIGSTKSLAEPVYRMCLATFRCGVDMEEVSRDEVFGNFLMTHVLQDMSLVDCQNFLIFVLSSQAIRRLLAKKDNEGYRRALKQLEETPDLVKITSFPVTEYFEEVKCVPK